MIISIKNAVNTRLFGAYEPQKIIFDLSHYTKSRPALKSGGFFCGMTGMPFVCGESPQGA